MTNTLVNSKRPLVFSFFTTVIFWVAALAVIFAIPLQKIITAEKKYTIIKINLADIPFNVPLSIVQPNVDENSLTNEDVDFSTVLHDSIKLNADKSTVSVTELANMEKTIAPPLVAIEKKLTEPVKAVPSVIPTKKTEARSDKQSSANQTKSIPSEKKKTPLPVSHVTPPESTITGVPITAFEESGAIISAVDSDNANALKNATDLQQTALNLLQPLPKVFTRKSSTNAVTYEVSPFFGFANDAAVVALKMTDGTLRKLLSPAEPILILSSDSENSLFETTHITIKLRILATGTVSASNLQLESSSALPPEIQTEIKTALSKWQFDSALGFTQATFQYRIIK